jgi:beta-lactamase regulating signal transducer with metallopeptidase domain
VIDHFGHALAAWLVPVNAWAAALFACAWLLDRALGRRMRASFRMALYAPVALRVLLPLSWTLPGARLPGGVVLLPLQSLTGSAAPAAPALASWPAGLVAGYVLVAAVLAGLTVARRASLARALRSAWPAEVPGAPYPVLRHPELGPMVTGLVAPRIVMPDALIDGASAETLACVIKHEAAHVRRGDPWLAAAMEWLLVACWPVAALWLAVARVRHLMELACDEAALSGADASERRRYGHVLLDVAEHGPMAFSSAGSLHFGSTLRARIEAIAMHRPWPRAVQGALAAGAVAGFVACSSAGPGVAPQATGGTQAAAAAGSVDAYGYEYEADPARTGADAKSPMAASTTNENGRLAPEVIQHVVRESFGRFRSCYEAGLAKNARLQGRVTVSFVIEQNGAVHDASDHGSDIADPAVVQCVVDGFGRLSFPPPQGGYVTVIYPIEFSPGD